MRRLLQRCGAACPFEGKAQRDSIEVTKLRKIVIKLGRDICPTKQTEVGLGNDVGAKKITYLLNRTHAGCVTPNNGFVTTLIRKVTMHIPRAHLLNPGMNLQQHSSILLRELTFIFTKEGVKPNMGYFILSPKVRADPHSTSPTKSQQYEKGYSSLQNNLFCSIAQMMGGESIPHWTTSLYFLINELYTLTTFLYIANHCQPVSCAWLLRAWML